MNNSTQAMRICYSVYDILSYYLSVSSIIVFFFTQKTSYEMRISDWSSDVCSSDLTSISGRGVGMDIVKSNIEKIGGVVELRNEEGRGLTIILRVPMTLTIISGLLVRAAGQYFAIPRGAVREILLESSDSVRVDRSEEHTSEIQSLMRISYPVFCLKKN